MQSIIRSSRIFLGLSVLFVLSACATGSSRPDVVQPLAAAATAAPHLTDVSIEVKPGVVLTQEARARIIDLVKTEITAEAPQAFDPGATPMKLQITVTEYDEGNAFARAMLAGLGQIRISADIDYVDATTGAKLGAYQVSKDFAFGGVYGATTNVQDVEKGFAKSVAETLKTAK